MRLTALLAVIFLPLSAALPQHAQAAGECIEASALSGPAPLHVSFRATCGAAAYRWDFGDGSTAVGAETAHDFTAGAFTVTLERTFLDGSSTRTSVDIASFALQLDRLPATRYGSERVFRGSLVPAASGVEVILERAGEAITSTRTDNSGRFAFRVRVINPGPYVVRAGDVVSAEITVKVRPRLHISLSGLPLVGQPLRLRIRVQPVESGEVELVALRDNRRVIDRQVDAGKAVALPTGRVARYVLWVTLRPADGYGSVVRKMRFTVATRDLSLGSHGPAVRALERSLAEHRFALARVDSSFDYDTVDALYALQKLAGLPRTGRANEASWRALERVRVPRAQLSGSYIEVDKTKQLLYVVRDGRITLIVPVSTGATGNTPLGVWHVYGKIAGWSWVLYFPNYFLRGFAIHGYPSVPPWPASHGCVRVPMWVAVRLYSLIPLGSRIFIHY